MGPNVTPSGPGEASNSETNDNHALTRRRILNVAGGATAAGVGMAAFGGTAAAETCEPGEIDAEIVFCGCSQVCWCVDYCTIVSVITETDVIHYTNHCFEDGVGYEEEGCHEDDDKVLAVQVTQTPEDSCFPFEDQKIYCNPNNCAERERERMGDDWVDEWGECEYFGDSASDVPGGCGSPPCEDS